MKKIYATSLAAVVWAGIVFYLIWAGHLGAERRADTRVERLRVNVCDSTDIGIVRPADVRRWITDAGLDPTGLPIDSVDLSAITRLIAGSSFVKDVHTSVDLAGRVTVTVSQRKPVMRVVTEPDYNFYYTEDGWIVPAGRRTAHYVPVVTGRFGLPFDRNYAGPLERTDNGEKKSDGNYLFLYKLINFVEYIYENDFWNAQIVQINVIPGSRRPDGSPGEPEVEFIPRVGDHTILLGTLDDCPAKLAKLLRFYRKAMPVEGWDKWNYIDLRFEDQVVCSKR